ncbi:MAG: hypothetical protein VX938_06645 [Myxococcota bacterium]|nr:hypothetical protein [Myxococcota bacterium]MEE2779822.1 hypothetical protein [Myxococcota bacterium]
MRHARNPLCFLFFAIFMVGMGSACGDGDGVGAPCDDDAACGYGLQCFLPEGESGPVCTISCQQVSCAQGICIQARDGVLCAAECGPGETCTSSSHTCQMAESGEQVCWYDDPNLDPLPEGLMPLPVQVRDDTNGDGQLNPTETATVDIYVENLETSTLSGLWARLVDAEQGVEVTTCKMPASPNWLTCSEYCSCQPHSLQSELSVAAGETSDEPIISMEVQLSASATETREVNLVFHDQLGRTWERSVDLPIVEL